MNVRVLLVLAAVLVAGVVAPRQTKRERSPSRKPSPGTGPPRKKTKNTEHRMCLPPGPRVTRKKNMVVLNRIEWLSTAKNKPKIGTRTCHFTAGTDTDPYGTVRITDKKESETTGETFTAMSWRLDPNRVRFRHLDGTTGLHGAERACSLYAGNNENLFTWKNIPTNSRRSDATNEARLCTQLDGNTKSERKMLKIKKSRTQYGQRRPDRLAMNHAAAHVEIQIGNTGGGSKWATVPGAWLIPTSDEANRNGSPRIWHKLRTDLIGEHSVTAIRLRSVRKEYSSPAYWGEQMRLYPLQSTLPVFPGYRENQIALYASPLWQNFAADSPRSIVMAWSYLGHKYSKIQALVDNTKLEFKMYGPCQFIDEIGSDAEVWRNTDLIKLIVPPFKHNSRRAAGIPKENYRQWSASGETLSGYVWYRRKEYVSGNDCAVAATKSEL